MGISAIIGLVAGLIGSIVTTVGSFKLQKLKNEHERDLAKIRIDTLKAEAEMQIKVTEKKVDGEIQLKEMDGFIQSQKQSDVKLFDSKWIDRLMSGTTTPWITRLLDGGKVAKVFGIIIGSIFGFIERAVGTLIALSFAFVDVLKAFIRPGLTIYLTGLSTWLTYVSWMVIVAHGQQAVTIEVALGLFKVAVHSVITLTVTAISWWYADRRLAKDAIRIMGKFFNA